MTLAVLYKLLAIMATVALGWLAARLGWFGRIVARAAEGASGNEHLHQRAESIDAARHFCLSRKRVFCGYG